MKQDYFIHSTASGKLRWGIAPFARKVILRVMPKTEFFHVRELGLFQVSEARTGAYVAAGHSLIEAQANAAAAIEKMGKAKFRRQVAEMIRIYGLSPRYKKGK